MPVTAVPTGELFASYTVTETPGIPVLVPVQVTCPLMACRSQGVTPMSPFDFPSKFTRKLPVKVQFSLVIVIVPYIFRMMRAAMP